MMRVAALLLVVTIILLGVGVNAVLPRGLRNNNPGNIKHDPRNNWLGQIGVDPGGFVIFSSMDYGLRAMARVLRSKMARGLTTIATIIPDYSATDQAAYIRNVSHWIGKAPGEELTEADLPSLMAAMIRQENGRELGLAMIEQGIAIA